MIHWQVYIYRYVHNDAFKLVANTFLNFNLSIYKLSALSKEAAGTSFTMSCMTRSGIGPKSSLSVLKHTDK